MKIVELFEFICLVIAVIVIYYFQHGMILGGYILVWFTKKLYTNLFCSYLYAG